MRWKYFFILLLLASMWGPSYLLIKICTEEMSPYWIAAGRSAIGAIILFGLLKLKGMQLPKKVWGHLIVNGFFAGSLPFVLFGFGEQRISSSLAGVINGLTPVIAALLAHFYISSERLNRSRLIGVMLGLAGFLVLVIPPLFTQSLMMDSIGVLTIGLAASSYAIAMVYGKKYLYGTPPLACATGQLLISSLYLIPLALIFEPGLPTLSWKGAISLAGLGVMGTATAMGLYFYLLEKTSVTFLSLSNYLLPVFSTIIGAIVLGEMLSWTAYLAGGMILLGMMVVNRTINIQVTTD